MGLPSQEAIPEAQLERLLESFGVDPGDLRAFRTLEEHLFHAGSWSRLAGVYECRLSVVAPDAPERGEILLRLGRVLEERLNDLPAGRRRYEEATQEAPVRVEALARLRGLLVRLGDLTSALQVAELEEQVERPPEERARLLAEIASLWQALGEGGECRQRLRAALDLDPECGPALEVLSDLAESDGRPEEALELLERRLPSLSGTARAPLLERIARLIASENPERAVGLLNEVIALEPSRASALEGLLPLEGSRRNWVRVEEICGALWRLRPDAKSRLQLARRAAELQQDEPDRIESTLEWTERAAQLAPDDVEVQEFRVRVLRDAGHAPALIRALEQLVSVVEPRPGTTLELARLHDQEGNAERACEWVRFHLEANPDDVQALVLLERCLQPLDRPAEQIEVIERRAALAETAKERARLLVKLARVESAALGNSPRAEDAYRRALFSDPEDLDAATGLESLLRERGRPAELAAALQSLAEGTAPAPVRAHWWARLAATRIEELDDTEGAVGALRRALEVLPGSPEALTGLREIARLRDLPALRLEACERELAIGPEESRLGQVLSEAVQASLEAGDAERASRLAARWVDNEPGAVALGALASAARAARNREQEKRALLGLEPLLCDDPDARADCLSRLADLELAAPDPDAIRLALPWLEEALAVRPDPVVRRRLAELYRRLGSWPDLIRVLREGFEDGTSEGEGGAVALARTLEQEGDLEGAHAVLQEAYTSTPETAGVAEALGSVLIELGRTDEAVELLHERLERETDPHRREDLAVHTAEVLLDRLSRPEGAAEILRSWARPERSGRTEVLFTRALEASGDDAELEGWLEWSKAGLEGPRRLETLLQLARLQEKSGRIPKAIATLWRAEQEAPVDRRGPVRTSLRALLASHGEPEDRLALIDLLLTDTDEGPARSRLRIDRARLLAEQLGRPEDACRELERARAEAPLPAPALRRLADLYHSTGRPDAELRCLRELVGVVRGLDDQRRVTLRIATFLVRGPVEIRDPESAEPLLFDLLRAKPNDAEATALLVEALEETGRREKLVALLEERLEMELEADERRALTLRLVTLGTPDRAVALLRTLRDTLGPHPASDLALADALRSVGDPVGEAGFARACARETSPESSAREQWLARWLDALERSGALPDEQLDQVVALLEEFPDDALLLRARLALLRQEGPEAALADTLEQALERTDVLHEGERRQALRELVFLWDGPLARPGQALARVERELPNDPSLALLLSRLAARSSDRDRLIEALHPLVIDPPEGFDPSPQDVRRLALALWEAGRVGEAEPLLHRTVSSYVDDLEVVRALDAIARTGKDRGERLRWLEARYSLESLGERARIAGEAFELCEAERDEDRALKWIRRWEELAPLAPGLALRWIDLERQRGDRTSELEALRTVDERLEQPELRARLLARRAVLHEQAGEWDLARVARGEAVRTSHSPDPELLRAWERSLRTPDRALDRAEALARLAAHPSVSPEDQTEYAALRANLLAANPALCEEAAVEFRSLFDAATDEGRRITFGRRLLDLYRSLGLEHEWCRIAEALVPEIPREERADLLRGLARELESALGANDRAMRRWHEVLDLVPEDREALETLARLLEAPGHEARRAAILERLADAGGSDGPKRLTEAARIRWRVLGDASWALADLERAISERPDDLDAHELRLEVCAHLAQPEEEAASLRALLKLEGDRPVAAERWLRLAQVLVGLPDTTAEVRTAAERALTLAPADIQLRAGARRVLERVGDWDRVAELLREEAADAEPALAAARVRRLARVEWLDRHDPARASEAFEALGVLDTLTAEDRTLYADVLSDLGRWPEALDVRAEALRVLGRRAPPQAWLELANARLGRLDDAEAARSACAVALELDAGCIEALRLLADLDARLEDHASEMEHRELLGERLTDRPQAAAELARAATVAREHLDDSPRAQILYTQALELDPSCVPALLGTGELSFQLGDFEEAEGHLARASSLLARTPYSSARAEVARLAARAAARLGREDAALEHIEIALSERPDDLATLELASRFAVRASAWERARDVLLALLARDDLDSPTRVDSFTRLAQAREALGDLEGAADALEEATALRPEAGELRDRLIDLLERTGNPVRAVGQLDSWSHRLPPEDRRDLAFRAARIELRIGRTDEARARLHRILHENPAEADAWRDVLPIVLEQDGPEAALERTSEALTHVVPDLERVPILVTRALAFEKLGRTHEAAEVALTALEADPGSELAAACLATHVGRTGEWQRAARALERTLQVSRPLPTMEATLWEAVGRIYAGPLEDLERAERAYRRSLACNPDHDRAREALADVTSFQPEAHAESLRLHLVLLRKFPGRRTSWRALERISAHASAESARAICRWVLCSLDGERERDEATRGARELLSRLEPSPELAASINHLREHARGSAAGDGLPRTADVVEPLQRALANLVGPCWFLDDGELGARLETLGRRERLGPGRDRERSPREGFTSKSWRSEVLAVSAARAAGLGLMGLRESIEALLATHPESAGLDLRAHGDLAEALQLCPAATHLLVHLAESVLSRVTGS